MHVFVGVIASEVSNYIMMKGLSNYSTIDHGNRRQQPASTITRSAKAESQDDSFLILMWNA